MIVNLFSHRKAITGRPRSVSDRPQTGLKSINFTFITIIDGAGRNFNVFFLFPKRLHYLVSSAVKKDALREDNQPLMTLERRKLSRETKKSTQKSNFYFFIVKIYDFLERMNLLRIIRVKTTERDSRVSARLEFKSCGEVKCRALNGLTALPVRLLLPVYRY